MLASSDDVRKEPARLVQPMKAKCALMSSTGLMYTLSMGAGWGN